MPKKHALIIANTEYRDAKLAPLPVPGQGYAELAEAMKDPARGAFTQVEILANANLSQILHSLDRFFSRRSAEDFLLVYFCGHSLVDAQGEIYLALRDSDRYRLKSTALMAAVLGMNMDLCPSPHKALILDCRFHATGVPTAPPRLQLDKVFAGRGLPKLVFSASDAVEAPGRAAAPEESPAAEFTRVLTECLRPPTGAAGKKAPFTLADWWNATLAPFKASGQPNAPRLQAVGNPPETVLRGMPMPHPEMALSAASTGDTTAPGVTPPPAASDEVAEEMQWSRLSGIFPLEMIAPELAISQEGSTVLPETEAPRREDAPSRGVQGPGRGAGRPDSDDMFDLRVPPALDGERTMMWDRRDLMKAMRDEDKTPRDSFSDLRARLMAQEEVEKEKLIEEEEEEAANQKRLEQWKARWEHRREGSRDEEDAAEKAARSPIWSHLAELQKTIYFDSPDADADVAEPPKPQGRGFPTGGGLDTVIVSKEEFLEPGFRAPQPPAPPRVQETPEEPGPAEPTIFAPAPTHFEQPSMDEGEDAPLERTLEMESREGETLSDLAEHILGEDSSRRSHVGLAAPEDADDVPAAAAPEAVPHAAEAAGSVSVPGSLPRSLLEIDPDDTRAAPPGPSGTPGTQAVTVYTEDHPARESRRRPVRAPKRGSDAPKKGSDKADDAIRMELGGGRTSIAKRIAWIGIGFVPVFLMVLLYFAMRSGLFEPEASEMPAAKVVPAEDMILPPAPEPETRPSASPEAPRAPEPPAAPPAPQSPRLPAEPARATAEAAAKPASAKPAARTKRAPTPADGRSGDFELASPESDSILAASVKETLQSDAGSLQAIYDRFALGFPGLKGELTVELKVDPSGWILEGTVLGSNTEVDMFDQEILRKVLGWKLRSFPGDKPRSVPVPLRFPLNVIR